MSIIDRQIQNAKNGTGTLQQLAAWASRYGDTGSTGTVPADAEMDRVVQERERAEDLAAAEYKARRDVAIVNPPVKISRSFTTEATERQVDYIRDLAVQRDWKTQLFGEGGTSYETVTDVLDGKVIGKQAASAAIGDLLKCRPVITAAATVTGIQSDLAQLRDLLTEIPPSKYALPHADGNGITFFEVVERRNGARYLNQLVGAPGDWRRMTNLSVRLQLYAARHIAEDCKTAAKLFADAHGVCAKCGSPLSDATSRSRGIGPVCWNSFS